MGLPLGSQVDEKSKQFTALQQENQRLHLRLKVRCSMDIGAFQCGLQCGVI